MHSMHRLSKGRDVLQALTINCDVRDKRFFDGQSFYFEAEQVPPPQHLQPRAADVSDRSFGAGKDLLYQHAACSSTDHAQESARRV
mmetsp:Transcript_30013/g.69952  ORF Transcript_30013/g.69952 Transcript_30013/m.69952 type:complete len:86 (+) Transcript_30013:42-299(+)|eukprot:CAMPEP_0119379250 /NCGR_PEP_ID=MMETSP1334-20130426/51862_1 /TAXON_ID=127549 /ORGANISM="Calcidiscus leptoporus, Strain RCC1130" /LENGTH=85 /DNA_ID=CAMNT_0007398707 /DNA_START=42 /DNA_END=299 /DNA_ORIENTATION=+